jgi:hypothetical protein
MLERKKTVMNSIALSVDLWYLRYFSKYRKIVRLIGWMLRWRNLDKNHTPDLSNQEEVEAERVLLQLVQQGMTEDSPLVKQVRATKGEDGLWRVSTKILWRDDLSDFKRPILIPGEHPIVGLIVRDVHEKNSHAAYLDKFWISRAKQVVKKVVSACVRCRRFDTKKIFPPEPPLPLDRVKDVAVFEVVGIDLGGPLYLKGGMKSSFVVYTCAVYRAVHLELVTSLSTDAFLLSLRRFIARRGRPKVIYSDNGTNFEGAHNLLRHLDWTKIQGATQFQMIDSS